MLTFYLLRQILRVLQRSLCSVSRLGEPRRLPYNKYSKRRTATSVMVGLTTRQWEVRGSLHGYSTTSYSRRQQYPSWSDGRRPGLEASSPSRPPTARRGMWDGYTPVTRVRAVTLDRREPNGNHGRWDGPRLLGGYRGVMGRLSRGIKVDSYSGDLKPGTGGRVGIEPENAHSRH